MALAKKLGESYKMVADQVKLKTITIDMGAFKFDLKVRVPLKKEMERITVQIAQPPKKMVEAIYNDLAAPLLKTIEDGGEDFLKAINTNDQVITVLDDDIFVQGSSVRQVAQFTAMWHTRVEVYFSLLQSESGEPINETYEQIAEEFTEQMIRKVVEDIESAIRPDYKTAKKN